MPGFDKQSSVRIARTVLDHEAATRTIHRLQSGRIGQELNGKIRWHPARNDSDADLPLGSLCYVTGTALLPNDGRVLKTVIQPAIAFNRDFAVTNNWGDIPAKNSSDSISYGAVANEGDLWVKCAGTPMPGQMYGPAPGTGDATAGYPGLRIHGEQDSSNGLYLATIEPIVLLTVRVTETIAKGSTGTAKILINGTDAGFADITILNFPGPDLTYDSDHPDDAPAVEVGWISGQWYSLGGAGGGVQIVPFVTLEDLGTTTALYAKATIGSGGTAIAVYDFLGLFPMQLSGALGWCYDAGTTVTLGGTLYEVYNIIYSQEQAILIRGSLPGSTSLDNMLPSSATSPFWTSVALVDPFVLAPPDGQLPAGTITAYNVHRLSGAQGGLATVVWNATGGPPTNDPQWEIIQCDYAPIYATAYYYGGSVGTTTSDVTKIPLTAGSSGYGFTFSSTNHDFTVGQSGLYRLTANFAARTNSGGSPGAHTYLDQQILLAFYVNNITTTTVIGADLLILPDGSCPNVPLGLDIIVPLAAGDVVDIRITGKVTVAGNEGITLQWIG